jgi:hypothetical protein
LKFNLDIAEHCDFDLVPEFLFLYRVRAGSMSTNIDAMLRSRKVVIEEARERAILNCPTSSFGGQAHIKTASSVWLTLATGAS